MAAMTTAVVSPAAVAASVNKRFYQPELDGLRFYAFLGVFMYHTVPSQPEFYSGMHLPFPALFAAAVKAGAAGVDLFFVLSAFLITSLLLRETSETGGISLRRFYMRRILRIWPLYFAVLALGVVLAHTVKTQHFAWYYATGFFFFVGNWVMAAFGRTESICVPMWTVSIEEQFYLLWPLLMKLLKRRGMAPAAVVVFLAATVSQSAIVLAGVKGGYIYYGSISRCTALALGVLLALYSGRLLPGRAVGFSLLGAGVASWIVASAWLVDQPGVPDQRMVAGRFLITLGAGAILLACLNSRNALLRSGWIVRLGKISFGLYLLHPTGILLARNLSHATAGLRLLAVKGAGLVITILLAEASYRWLEAPFLRLKDRYATVFSRPV
jgi:peptidoglycan/LPS O-acetylase OafA/YrhL